MSNYNENLFHLISIIIELIGLFLIIIELKFKGLSDRFQNSLNNVETKLNKVLGGDEIIVLSGEFASSVFIWTGGAVLISLILLIILTALHTYIFNFQREADPFLLIFLSATLFIGITFFISLTILTVIGILHYIFLRLVSRIIKNLNIISNGKAISSIGLLISILAVLKELFAFMIPEAMYMNEIIGAILIVILYYLITLRF